MAASCQRQNLSPATASRLPAATQRIGWSFLPLDHPITLAWLRRWPPSEGIGIVAKRGDFWCGSENMQPDAMALLLFLRSTKTWHAWAASNGKMSDEPKRRLTATKA